ncbi:MAG: PASTA domain-containing protein, partial [Calditrichia bacterium]
FELPDVTDRTLQEAEEVLNSEGFEPLIEDSVYDEKFAPGNVVRQTPMPYSMVKKGRRVYLVVSIGERPHYMPKLIGSTPQDAEFRVKEEGLVMNRVVHAYSDFYPRGVVINQSVPPGEEVKRNQKINITVSLGQAPTSIQVPNLMGKSLESARKELQAIGLNLGAVKYTYRPNLVPGTILRQSVSPGQNAATVDSLELVVSTDQEEQEKGTDADSLP